MKECEEALTVVEKTYQMPARKGELTLTSAQWLET